MQNSAYPTVSKSFAVGAGVDAFVTFGPFNPGDTVDSFVFSSRAGATGTAAAAGLTVGVRTHGAKPGATAAEFNTGRSLVESPNAAGAYIACPDPGQAIAQTLPLNWIADETERYLTFRIADSLTGQTGSIWITTRR